VIANEISFLRSRPFTHQVKKLQSKPASLFWVTCQEPNIDGGLRLHQIGWLRKSLISLSPYPWIRAKYMKGPEEFLNITTLMDQVPQTPQEMERLKYGVYHNPLIYGALVSPDARSTIVLADFRIGLNLATDLPVTDPVTIYKNEVEEIPKAIQSLLCNDFFVGKRVEQRSIEGGSNNG
jgi:hypothetical protein